MRAHRETVLCRIDTTDGSSAFKPLTTVSGSRSFSGFDPPCIFSAPPLVYVDLCVNQSLAPRDAASTVVRVRCKHCTRSLNLNTVVSKQLIITVFHDPKSRGLHALPRISAPSASLHESLNI